MIKEFSGAVVSGKGEGSYYVGRYNSLFRERLGFLCFPGTLDIRAGGVSFPNRFISICPGERFREVRCYRVVLNDRIEAFAVVPQISGHDANIVEMVSGKNLREELGLNDGDSVTVRFIE
jgi:riboflavin kinase